MDGGCADRGGAWCVCHARWRCIARYCTILGRSGARRDGGCACAAYRSVRRERWRTRARRFGRIAPGVRFAACRNAGQDHDGTGANGGATAHNASDSAASGAGLGERRGNPRSARVARSGCGEKARQRPRASARIYRFLAMADERRRDVGRRAPRLVDGRSIERRVRSHVRSPSGAISTMRPWHISSRRLVNGRRPHPPVSPRRQGQSHCGGSLCFCRCRCWLSGRRAG